MFVQRSILAAFLAGSLSLGSSPVGATDLVMQNTGGSLRDLFNGEPVRVTRGPADFFSIFRPKQPKKQKKTSRARRAPSVTVSPRPRVREAATISVGLAGLGAIEDTVAKQALDDGMGRLAGYQTAEAARVEIEARLAVAREMLDQLKSEAEVSRGPAAILRDLEALDLESDGYAEDFATLKAELDASDIRSTRLDSLTVEIARLETVALAAADRANEAFTLAANGRDLAPDTRRDLNYLLGLPTAEAR